MAKPAERQPVAGQYLRKSIHKSYRIHVFEMRTVDNGIYLGMELNLFVQTYFSNQLKAIIFFRNLV